MKALRAVLRYGILVILPVAVLAVGSLAEARGEQRALDVNSVASDPMAYKGSIQIQGVVSRVSPEDSTFVMIDLREYKACQSVTCPTVFVPVHYGKSLPEIKDMLVVTGEISSNEDSFVLNAQKIQPLKK